MVDGFRFLTGLRIGGLSNHLGKEDLEIRPISTTRDEGDQGYENSNRSQSQKGGDLSHCPFIDYNCDYPFFGIFTICL